MVSVENLNWGYPLIDGVTRWHHESRRVTFPGTSCNMYNFLVDMSTFKQAIKMKMGRNKFAKMAVKNLQTVTHQLGLSESIPNSCFKFVSCQENCKQYVVMNNSKFAHEQMFYFSSIGVLKCFCLKLNQSCQIYLKNSNPFWRFVQNANWIATKLDAKGENNRQFWVNLLFEWSQW